MPIQHPKLREELLPLSEGNHKVITVNLKEVSYMDSTGIRRICRIVQTAGQKWGRTEASRAIGASYATF